MFHKSSCIKSVKRGRVDDDTNCSENKRTNILAPNSPIKRAHSPTDELQKARKSNKFVHLPDNKHKMVTRNKFKFEKLRDQVDLLDFCISFFNKV